MLITTEVARIPLKVPMMLAQSPNVSLSHCVAVTHTDVEGISDGVVYVVESEVTKTPANFKGRYQLSHFQHGFKEEINRLRVFQPGGTGSVLSPSYIFPLMRKIAAIEKRYSRSSSSPPIIPKDIPAGNVVIWSLLCLFLPPPF